MEEYLYPDAVVYMIIVLYEFYIGSTMDIKNRLRLHKATMECGCHYKLYTKMREYGLQFETDDIEIIILEKYPCDDKKYLRRREGEYQRELEPTLNSMIAGRTKEEWTEENKQHIQEYMKNHYEENKEKKIQYQIEYQKTHKTIISEKMKQKVKCKYCQKEITKSNIAAHIKRCPDRPSSSS